MEATLQDLERCTKITAAFLKNAAGKGDGGCQELYQKLEASLGKAKVVEVCLMPSM